MDTNYGIDPNQPVTPLTVRDALSECFYHAHCQDSEIGDNEEISRSYCISLIKKIFNDTRSDYDNPTKKDLEQVIKGLMDFSSNFRNPELIQKHADEIQDLMDQLPE